MFDWIRFFQRYGIHYVTSGPNVSRGRAAVKCPFCGQADPSEHMTVALRGMGWRCWRNPRAHSGRERARLIEALLRCSFEEARRIAEEDTPATPADADVVSQLGKLLGLEPRRQALPGTLALPPEFKILGPSGLARPFWAYLTDERGYTAREAAWVAENYGLRYATQGPYRYRLIIPVTDAEERLACWTARTILPGETLRYKTVPTVPPFADYDGPLAIQPPGRLLLGLPLLLRCPNPEILVLCEGPFDAMRVSVLGHQLGVYGTCLFGLNVTDSQVLLLERLMGRFSRIILLLDPDAQMLNLRILTQLTFPVQFAQLPAGVEDPGELTGPLAAAMMRAWLKSKEGAYG